MLLLKVCHFLGTPKSQEEQHAQVVN